MIRIGFAAALTALVFGGAEPVSLSISDRAAQGLVTSEAARADMTVTEIRGGLAIVSAKLSVGGGEVREVTLQMYDGEEATVALPGHAATPFHFRRVGDRVETAIGG